MPTTGRLRDISLANLIQLNCVERKSGRLVLERFNRIGEVFFADGEVVDARLDSAQGEEAVYRLLMWEDGSFRIEEETDRVERTIHVGYNNLILEGMRRADELRSPDNEAMQKLCKHVSGIAGVEGAGIVWTRGDVVSSHPSGLFAAKDTVRSVLVGALCELLGGECGLGGLVSVTFSSPEGDRSVLPYHGVWCVLTHAGRDLSSSAADEVSTYLMHNR